MASIWQRIRTAFGLERREKVRLDDERRILGLFGLSESGVNVNSKTALTLSAFFRAISIRASLVATLPRGIYEKTENGINERLDHPASRLLKYLPGHPYTAFDFWFSLEAQACLFGGGGAEIVRDDRGRPSQLRLFKAGASVVEQDGNYFVQDNDSGRLFLLDDALYLPGLMVTDGVTSKSLIHHFRDTFGEQLAARIMASKLWQNGPFLGGVYTYTGRKRDDMEAFALDLRNYFGGASKAGMILPIPNGEEFKQLQPVDMSRAQLIEARRFGVEEVARITGVPVSLLMELDKPSYNSLSQLFLQFKITTIDPRLTQIDQELTRKLLLPGEQGRLYIETNVDEMMWASPQERIQYWEGLFKMAAITPNEIRAYLNKNPLEGGDSAFVQVNNLAPIDQLNNLNSNEPQQRHSSKNGTPRKAHVHNGIPS